MGVHRLLVGGERWGRSMVRADGEKLTAGRELSDLMRMARQRLPGPPSQEQMAQRCGMSTTWYGRLERGDTSAHYSAESVHRVALALELNASETDHLLRLTGHATGARPEHFELSEARRIDVLSRPLPTYISDSAWDVRLANAAAILWLPWMAEIGPNGVGPNVMKWVFLTAEARYTLVPWRRIWAPLMMAQMRTAFSQQPDNDRLREVIDDILAEPDNEQMWHALAPYEHPDGDIRQIRLPFYSDRIIDIEINAADPMQSPHARVMSLIPIHAADRDEIYRALRHDADYPPDDMPNSPSAGARHRTMRPLPPQTRGDLGSVGQ